MKCLDLLPTQSPNIEEMAVTPNVGCQPYPDVHEESLSIPDVWSTSTGFPPRTRYDHAPRRRIRSRSSPVRARDDNKGRRVRARSPSACSPRRRARDHIREHTTRSGRPTFIPSDYTGESNTPSEEYMPTSNSYRCGPIASCGTAYFSLRPPAAPLHLVPIVTPLQPPLPPPLYSGVTRIARVTFAKNEPEESNSSVRCLIQDLVATLPLKTSSREAAVCTSTIDHSPQTECDQCVPISKRSYVKIRHSKHENSSCSLEDLNEPRRSIATQAKTSFNSDPSRAVKRQTRSGSPPAEEWLGGVRALRDSHVRLVLRQLRHIERLNRALDRAVRVTPPPNSTPKASQQRAPLTVSDTQV